MIEEAEERRGYRCTAREALSVSNETLLRFAEKASPSYPSPVERDDRFRSAAIFWEMKCSVRTLFTSSFGGLSAAKPSFEF